MPADKTSKSSRGGSRKNTTKNKSNTRNKQSSKDAVISNSSQYGHGMLDEIILICLILISIVMAISMFSSSMGFFGDFIRTFLKGLLGFGGYVVPFVLCIFCVWMLASGVRNFVPVKIAGSVGLLIFVSAFAQALGGDEGTKILDFWKNGSATNGGFIGGILDLGLGSVFGGGKYIILVALIIISFIAATGKSLINAIYAAIGMYNIKKMENEERIKSRAEQIRRKDEMRIQHEERYIPRKNTVPVFNPKKHKKGNFNIKIGEDEGYHPKEDLPVIEVPQFKCVPIEKDPEEKKAPIYDYDKVKKMEFKENVLPVIKSKKESNL